MMGVGINQMVHEDFQDGPNEHHDVEHDEAMNSGASMVQV
jgi:hypothetical protein